MFDPTLGKNSPQELALQTRRGGTIRNWMDPAVPRAGIELQMKQLKKDHYRAIHRNVGPSAQYNCHGLTFAARRTGISDPAQIHRILDHDGYEKLALTESPEIGDIAIYVEDGDIIHSGIVVGNRSGSPMILGKWGDCHEAIHQPLDCPYNKAAVTYYRLMK